MTSQPLGRASVGAYGRDEFVAEDSVKKMIAANCGSIGAYW
ncbi:hypothetical protein [Campylobacter concisus]|nr:hypothetical protein [Campylobacter concisus]